ncbi:DNA-binding SCF ubiquitin ligase subunit DIA2 [Lachancea thermotolerans CBS 6340]|uniref:KLTH0F18150p n=1 Tax=Lachancea thermotolerans (strain ATCC 56472 / CBS 6340 / NRRL Y-8284) TaxID=559295 RepID=C5DJP8_LACTC|nr:KLTH0F18150p [Lachancea thermotolerans CBS 6340]CAR24537.1 KLTH0F18150p [Lachancea thermotolerans CBS 6340]
MSDEDVVEKALDLGVVYFKNEDYKNANSLFTKAMRLARSYKTEDIESIRVSHGLSKRPFYEIGELVHPRLVKLLDNRAATWEKIGDLKKALKDANRATRFEPYNLKCYLRRGKILQKLRMDGQALENYEEGVKAIRDMTRKYHLDPPKKLYEALEYQKNLVSRRLKGPKTSVASKSERKRTLLPQVMQPTEKKMAVDTRAIPILDILGQCPLEILKKILCNLDSTDLSRCLLVSKVWHSRICLLPSVFNRFDLSSCTYRKIISFQRFINKMYVNAGRQQIDHIKFRSLAASTESKVIPTLLQDLKPLVKTLIIQHQFTDLESITTSLVRNKSLAAGLKEVSLTCEYKKKIGTPLEVTLMALLKKIQKLEMVFPNSSNANRSKVSIEDQNHELFIRNVQNLRSMRIICNHKNTSPHFPFKTIITSEASFRIEKLFISGVTFDTTMGFEWLANFSNLRELWLENNKNAQLEEFLRVVIYKPLFNKLSKLTFREHRITGRPVNLAQYPHLAENCNLLNNFSSIEHLDVMSSSIGAKGLLAVLSAVGPDQLKVLNIGDCPYIHFQRGNSSGFLDMRDLLLKIHHIEELCLHQSVALDDHAIIELAKNVRHIKKIRKLDLSFNMSLTGVSIYQMLRSFKEEFIILDKLIIDGCPSVSEGTVSALKGSGFVRELVCSYEKLAWGTFGINSLKYPS